MTPRLPRLVRTVLVAVHILAAMAWLALIVAMVLSPAAPVPPGVLVAPVLITVVVLALTTGCVLALCSPYGLVRYWWIAGKFAASLILAAAGIVSLLGWLPAAVAYGGRVAALVVLFAAVCVSVAKPRARTPWGRPPTGRHAKGRETRAIEA
jgi:hypothetical protein